MSSQDSITQIPLTRGLFSAIDARDLHLVTGRLWRATLIHGQVYATTYEPRADGTRKTAYLHRLILDAPEGREVDHKDGDTLNNVRSNLRLALHSDNMRNKKLPTTNTSGYKGVTRIHRRNPWVASIGFNGRHRHIGTFASAEEAARAYDDKARELFGEFARVNFPREGEVGI